MVFQVRATAGGVRDDRVVTRQRVLQCAGARDAFVEASSVGVQRAATALRPGNVHVETVGGEDACSCGIDIAEDDALDAAGDKRDARPRAGEMNGRPGRAQPRRRDLTERPQRPGRRQAAQEQRRTEPSAVRKNVEDQAA